MTQILRGLVLAALAIILLPSVAEAGHHEEEKVDDPLAAAAEFPLLLRRTTLIVRDIEASLKLYRDGLGMEVIYDQEINRPHSTEDREQRLRLIFLKASHDYVGVIGLIDYSMDTRITPPIPSPSAAKVLHRATPSCSSTLTAWRKSGRALKMHRVWRSSANLS
ncbi:MAG: hypothetical protein CM15mP84_02550 [Cellvibrionales bacterium]|nr:MAG: hypothetical protein CM15mP84_02550 [Cellvibrionales bacterium]